VVQNSMTYFMDGPFGSKV